MLTVAKVDATRFVKAANHFEIKGYPTIKLYFPIYYSYKHKFSQISQLKFFKHLRKNKIKLYWRTKKRGLD